MGGDQKGMNYICGGDASWKKGGNGFLITADLWQRCKKVMKNRQRKMKVMLEVADMKHLLVFENWK